MQKQKTKTRMLVTTAILGAVASVLMYLEFPLPFLIPSFIKLDFSDLPALLATFSMGPLAGVAVEVLKNVVHLFVSQSAGVGELANLILGCAFVVPTGIYYHYHKTRVGALVGTLLGALFMAAVSLPVNYYITYPFYTAVYGMTVEQIMAAYQALVPAVKNLWQALLLFNLPFTFGKGVLNLLFTFLIYKKLSPVLHGRK